MNEYIKSHPTWVRGLKYPCHRDRRAIMSHPYGVRGLKLHSLTYGYYTLLSHPQGAWIEIIEPTEITFRVGLVAPYTGAWIEIEMWRMI